MKTTLVLVVIASMLTALSAVDTSKPFDLTTTTGQTYKNCQISRVTPEGVTVVHDKGVAKIGFDRLSDEWKQQFNYDPEKARAFAQAEEEKRAAALALRAEMERKRSLSEEEALAELAAAERKRLEADAKAVQEHQDAVKAANTPPTALAPLPGDATPDLGILAPQPIMQTEVVVPTVTPVGDPYSPSRKIRSQSYIYSDGYLPYGYGYGYSYPYQPIYTHPGHFHHPHGTSVPPSSTLPGVSGSISVGGATFGIKR